MSRVIVTGSREFADRELVWRTLDDLYEPRGGLILVHGACPRGADKHADDWALARRLTQGNVLVDKYPANWSHGRGAGMARNAEMVKAGADMVLAFYQPGAGNKGTAHCVKLAQRAGIHVWKLGGVS